MSRLLQAKLLHFIVLGIVLYGVNEFYSSYQQRQLTCPSVQDIDLKAAKWAQQNRQPLTRKLRHALWQNALDEQMLVREALLKGMHKRDTVVRQRLLRDAEFLGIEGDSAVKIEAVLAMGMLESDEVIRRRLIQLLEHSVASEISAQRPSEAALKQLHEQSPALTEMPARYSFRQRFYAKATQAEQALFSLHRGEQAAAGDVFLSGDVFKELNVSEINSLFGAGFWPEQDAGLPLYHWLGPVKSVYGWHLIQLQEFIPGTVKDFASVRAQLTSNWRREQQQRHWQLYVTALRERYRVLCNDEV